MATGWITHERYLWHDPGPGAGFLPAGGMIEPDVPFENAATKRRFRNLVDASGLLEHLVPLAPRMATVDEVCRFHTRDYVERIRALSDARGGDAGELAPFGHGSFETALLAVGGCLAAVDAVLDGRVQNAYALVRPPGHHAEADRGRGFCLFGNTALAALHARARGLARVAVVDWDVHHGNGTQAAFWTDPTVLTVSVHQDGFYPPDSGTVDEIGADAGRGFTINVPLPPGSGVGAYLATFERVVVPAVRAYQPELILIASGLDASAMDPDGRMMLHSAAYRQLTRLMMGVAAEVCVQRLVLCHEGGYSTAYVPFCGLAIVEELSGRSTGVEDPFLAAYADMAYQDLQPQQDAVISMAEQHVRALRRAAPSARS